MSTNQSKLLNLSKKYPFLKKFYFFYNIYIRNFKFLFNSSQFGEEKKILELFDKDLKGVYVDLGCFHPTRSNNTLEMYKKGWHGLNVDLNPLKILHRVCLLNLALCSDLQRLKMKLNKLCMI